MSYLQTFFHRLFSPGKISVNGHAGYAPAGEADIVCATVSVLRHIFTGLTVMLILNPLNLILNIINYSLFIRHIIERHNKVHHAAAFSGRVLHKQVLTRIYSYTIVFFKRIIAADALRRIDNTYPVTVDNSNIF